LGSSTKTNLDAGDLAATIAVTRRFDLTDPQSALPEQLSPVAMRVRSAVAVEQAAAHRRRPVAGAERAPRRDWPARYGSWRAVYGLLRDGAFGIAHMLSGLAPFTADANGWGIYAERLAVEMRPGSAR